MNHPRLTGLLLSAMSVFYSLPSYGDCEPAIAVEFVGDSTQSGVDGAALTEKPPRISRVRPPSSFIGWPSVTITNTSISGATTKTSIEGSPTMAAWQEHVSQSKADIFIINYAINDSLVLSEADYQSNLRAMAEIAAAAGKTVVFETPNLSWIPSVAKYANLMRDTADHIKAPVMDVHQFLTATLGAANMRVLIPDGVHPSEKGYRVIGQYASAWLSAFLETRRAMPRAACASQ